MEAFSPKEIVKGQIPILFKSFLKTFLPHFVILTLLAVYCHFILNWPGTEVLHSYLTLVLILIVSSSFMAKNKVASLSAELQLHAYKNHLEELIGERTNKLQASEEQYRAVVENSHDGITIIQAGKIQFINQRICELLGYSAEEILGKEVSSFFSAEEFAKLRLSLVGRDHNCQDRISSTAKIQRNGDQNIIIESDSVLIQYQDHDAILCFLRDVTERKQVEEKLQKLTQAVEQSQSVVMITGVEGLVEYVNPKFTELTGYGFDEIKGKSPVMLRANKVRKGPDKDLWKTLIQGKKWRGVFHNAKKDGEHFWEDTTISSILDPQGNTTHYLAVKEDITQQKAKEQELLRAKDAARAATQAKTDFLATMSHEIRTPMNGVIGMSGLLRNTPLTEEQREYVEIICSCGQNLLSIINDILDYAKVDSGNVELKESPFSLHNHLENTLDIFKAKAAEKQIELYSFVDEGVPLCLYGDKDRLRQILINLIGNALKFTDKGEIIVSASSQKLPNGLVDITFAIQDTGIGIPQESINELFDAFSQVDSSTTRQYGGTGLGLAISKQLVELMSGTIWAESELHRGSTFFFNIQVTPVPIKVPAYLKKNIPEFRQSRLLLISSDTHRLKQFQELCNRWGVKLETTAPRENIMQSLPEYNPNFVILDCGITQEKKVSFQDKLEIFCAQQNLPLIVLQSIKQLLYESSKTICLTKPLKEELVFEAFRTTLKQGIVKVPTLSKSSSFTIDTQLAQKLPLSILLAEDHPINQKLAIKILSKLGYQTGVANNGLEVLREINKKHYDMIFMDIQMPLMDGLKTTQYILEKIPQERRPKIVAMTANAMAGDKERYLKAGMDDYISKPVLPEDIQTVLLRCFTQ